MMKAVIYARVSGDDSKMATSSIEAQLSDGRKYAAEKGYNLVGEFAETPDRQTSGADWLPEIDKVVKLAQSGGYDVLIVHKVDRLARNRFKQMSIENNLEYVGVRVEYVNGQYADTPEGRLLKGMVSEFAEFEREIITERTKRGKYRSAMAGNVSVGGSRAPYGYDGAKVDGRRQLVINDEAAAVVRVIFDLYGNQGCTLYQVKEYLDERGIDKPGKGNNHKGQRKKNNRRGIDPGWSVGTLRVMLSNETYIGRWYYRKTKRVKVGDGKYKQIPRPKSEWLLVEVPAIIDDELFNKVQALRERNKRQKGKQRKHFYLLGGMITCGHCGVNVSGVTKVDKGRCYGYYKCNARHLPKKFGYRCDLPQFRVDDVDSAVWEWIRSILLNPEELRRALEGYRARQADSNSPLESMFEANQAKLDELENEKDRLIKAYSAGVLSLDEIAKQKTDLDKQIATLTGAIASLHAELKEKTFTAEEMETIESLAAQYREEVELADSDPRAKRDILQLLSVEVVLSVKDGKKWADVSCKLGEKSYAVNSNSSGSYGFAWPQNGSSRLDRPYTAPSQTARRTCSKPRYRAPFPLAQHRAKPPLSLQLASRNPNDGCKRDPHNLFPGGAASGRWPA